MSKAKAAHAQPSLPSTVNAGIPFDLTEVQRFRTSEKAIQERADALAGHRLPRGKGAVDPLLMVLGAIDLTTLSGDDQVARVRRLCQMARSPLPAPLRRALAGADGPKRVAAVCVYPAFVPEALRALEGTDIPVATVSAGFPHGLSTLSVRTQEVAEARKAGAQEIDVVIRREWALSGNWKALYDEVRAFRKAAGSRHLKVILATGELGALNRVGRAALTSLMAGADFVKTSTGKEKVNATLPVGLAMVRAMSRYQGLSGFAAGIKPAGGIKAAKEAYPWLMMVREELGEEAEAQHRFRIGASSLLADVVSALEKAVLT